MEKMTFGEDRLIAQKDGLEVKSFINNSSFSQTLLLEAVEIKFIGIYTSEK